MARKKKSEIEKKREELLDELLGTLEDPSELRPDEAVDGPYVSRSRCRPSSTSTSGTRPVRADRARTPAMGRRPRSY